MAINNCCERYIQIILGAAERRPTMSEVEFDNFTWGDVQAAYDAEAAEAKRRYFLEPRRKLVFAR
jgi:hypothetical protein